MDSWQAQTLVSLIESATPMKVFTIWQLDLDKAPVDAKKWPIPSLVMIHGTELGLADVSVYRAPPSRFTIQEGKMVPIPKDQWRSLQAQDQFDAILYLGPASTMRIRQSHEIPAALCSEPGFLTRQLQRMALLVPLFELERLKKYCAEITAK